MYSKIDSMFWKDSKNKTLTNDEKLLFIYILTCPHKNILGLFVLPMAYIEADLKWNSQDDRVSNRVSNTLSSLCNKGYVFYDETTEVILIKNYLKYNPLESSKQMIGAIKILPDIPVSKLENTLISILSTFKDNTKSKDFNNGIDTLCHTLLDRVNSTLCHTSNSNSISNSISNTITTTIDNNINNIGFEEEKQEEVVVVEEDKVIDFYNKNIDKISDYSRLFIRQCREKNIPDELIIYAMELAVESKKKTIAYIKGILENWEKEDITSVLEAKQSTEEFKKQKNKTENNNNKANNYKNYKQREYKNLNEMYANKQRKSKEDN